MRQSMWVAGVLAIAACQGAARQSVPAAGALATTAPLAALTATDTTREKPPAPCLGPLSRDTEPSPYWDAIVALEPDAAMREARSPGERAFATALGAQLDGRDSVAIPIYDALIHSKQDSLLRTRAGFALLTLLQGRDRWESLDALLRDSVAGNILASSDRADILAWARTWRPAPPELYRVSERAVTLPLVPNEEGIPAIEVTINGKKAVFWLDTGASMTIVSSDVADVSGLKPFTRDTLAVTTVMGQVPVRAAVLDSLAFGGVTIRNHRVAIADVNDLALVRPNPTGGEQRIVVAGVIGASVLRQVRVLIDQPAGTITFMRPKPRVGSDRPRLVWFGYPVLRSHAFDGEPLLLGLDTGMQQTVALCTVLPKLMGGRTRAKQIVLGAIGRQTKALTLSLDVMPVEFEDRWLLLHGLAVDEPRRAAFARLDGVLGADLLKTRRVLLDFSQGLIATYVRGETP